MALVLGLALLGRRSELVALELDDVTETPDGLEVLIRASKTDKESLGLIVAIPHGRHRDTDPVCLVRAWWHCSPSMHHQRAAPSFGEPARPHRRQPVRSGPERPGASRRPASWPGQRR